MKKSIRTSGLIAVLVAATICGSGQAKNSAFTFDPNKVVDLTHVLADGIPDFHGDAHAFKHKPLSTVAKDGYAHGAYETH